MSTAAARVGVDAVHVPGLAARLRRSPGLARVLFTAGERRRARAAREPARALARSFAAKEAFLKALGRGLNPTGPDAWLLQLELEDLPGAEPALALGPAPARALARRGLEALTALSAAGGFALATVLLVPQAAAGGRSAEA